MTLIDLDQWLLKLYTIQQVIHSLTCRRFSRVSRMTTFTGTPTFDMSIRSSNIFHFTIFHYLAITYESMKYFNTTILVFKIFTASIYSPIYQSNGINKLYAFRPSLLKHSHGVGRGNRLAFFNLNGLI